MGENLPPGDSDWGNLTIASQQINTDPIIVSPYKSFGRPFCGIIAKELHERDKDV